VRVLCVGNRYPPGSLGGYEMLWEATVRDLRRAGHEVRVLTTVAEPGAEVRDPEGADVHRDLGWYWRDYEFPRLSRRERRRLVQGNAAVLERHLEVFSPDVVSWWAMGGMTLSLIEQVRRAGLPAIGVVGDAWPAYGPEVDGWLRGWRWVPRPAIALVERVTGVPARLDLGAAGRWLFISEVSRRTAELAGWRLPDTGIAHPGVDPQRFAPRPAEPWRWRLLYCGRIDPRKGIAAAVRALARLPAQATLTVDGDGDAAHGRELRELAAGLGLGERVTFVRTPSDSLADAYAAADVVVFPVEWEEPWGLVPLEAMAVGRPVVATGTGGSAEYLEDGGNSLLFAAGDDAALAKAVTRLAGDEELRARLREGGAATAARHTEAEFSARVAEAVREARRRSA
jgi:glycogen synthase